MLILRYHLCYSIRFKAPLNCFVKQPLKVNLFYDLLSRLASLATGYSLCLLHRYRGQEIETRSKQKDI